MNSPLGGVRIFWVDDSSAFVSLFRRENAALGKTTLLFVFIDGTKYLWTLNNRNELISSKANQVDEHVQHHFLPTISTSETKCEGRG